MAGKVGRSGRRAGYGKSLAQHLKDGTFRYSQHKHLLGDEPPPFRPKTKPTARVTRATIKSQRRWFKSDADERAFHDGYRFNVKLAEHVAEVFRTYFRHSQGRWAGDPLELTDFQRDEIIFPLFGWVDADGYRRFRKTYVEIPKKNGKSALASAIGLYMLVFDEEAGAEVYSLGADKDQARIVHNEAINMVEASPELKKTLQINKTTGTISYPATDSTYRALSGTPKGKHGYKPHCCILDELHEWPDDKLWNAIRYGYRMRTQPLSFVITNAGEDMESICYQQREKAQAVLDGEVYDPAFFAKICSASKADAESELKSVASGSTDLPVARECNPLIDTIVRESDLLDDVRDAIQSPREKNNLLRLTYGVWDCGGSEPWLDVESWDACLEGFAPSSLKGDSCILGLDLAKVRDMTSAVLVFREDDTYRVLPYFWLPRDRAEELATLISTGEWESDELLQVTEGNTCDYGAVRAFIGHLGEQFDIRKIVFDPREAEEMTQNLIDDLGLQKDDRISFNQGNEHYHGPTKEFERLVLRRQIRHNGHDILRWQVSHCRLDENSRERVRPVKPKKKDYRTVDGVQALIMALSVAMARDDSDYAYSDRGYLTL